MYCLATRKLFFEAQLQLRARNLDIMISAAVIIYITNALVKFAYAINKNRMCFSFQPFEHLYKPECACDSVDYGKENDGRCECEWVCLCGIAYRMQMIWADSSSANIVEAYFFQLEIILSK